MKHTIYTGVDARRQVIAKCSCGWEAVLPTLTEVYAAHPEGAPATAKAPAA